MFFATHGREDPRVTGGFDTGDGCGAIVSAAHEGGAGFPGFGADAFQSGYELLFVVGSIGDVAADDQGAFDFHCGLGVVALLEASAGFHDPAFGIGEVVLILIAVAFFGKLGGFSFGPFAGAWLFGLAVTSFSR